MREPPIRPVLAAAELSVNDHSATAHVTLVFGERQVQGSARRPVWEPYEAVAAATAMAISTATEILITVTAASTVTLHDRNLCITLVDVPALSKTLAGSVVIEGTEGVKAAARSVLHAVNRVITDPALSTSLRNELGVAVT